MQPNFRTDDHKRWYTDIFSGTLNHCDAKSLFQIKNDDHERPSSVLNYSKQDGTDRVTRLLSEADSCPTPIFWFSGNIPLRTGDPSPDYLNTRNIFMKRAISDRLEHLVTHNKWTISGGLYQYCAKFDLIKIFLVLRYLQTIKLKQLSSNTVLSDNRGDFILQMVPTFLVVGTV